MVILKVVFTPDIKQNKHFHSLLVCLNGITHFLQCMSNLRYTLISYLLTRITTAFHPFQLIL
jgi:hypothetical protein